MNSKIILLAIIAAILSNTALAVSIMPAKQTINFQPNSVHYFDFTIGGAERIESYITGDLQEYAELIDRNQKGPGRTITVKLRFPETLPSGEHRILVGAQQYVESQSSTIGGLARIQSPIYVIVPYPGVFLEAGLSTGNINEGETAKISATVENKGTPRADDVQVKTEIITPDNTIAQVMSKRGPVEGESSTRFDFEWNSAGYAPGPYKARATITYKDKTITKETAFTIGTLSVIVNSHTKDLKAGTINPFDIELESKWNREIKNVFAEVKLENEMAKTPTVSLAPLGRQKVTAYLDTAGMNLGEHGVTITINYEGRTSVERGTVTISEGAVEERPSGTKMNSTSPLITILLLITILAILAVAAILFVEYRRRK